MNLKKISRKGVVKKQNLKERENKSQKCNFLKVFVENYSQKFSQISLEY